VLPISGLYVRDELAVLQLGAADPALGLVPVSDDGPPADPREIAWLEAHCGRAAGATA
jgi:hypothetical protein